MAELKIQFLDVGQGDGIFIEFPGGATMLVDLGSTKNSGVVRPDILQYFRDNTKFRNPGETLDYLILTHGDRDHYNMVLAFLTDLQVKVGRLMFGGLESDYKGLIAKIKGLSPGVVQVTPSGYLPFQLANFGGAEVHVIAANTRTPLSSDEGWRKNSASVVLMLVYKKVRVILAGDATRDTEQYITSLFQHFRSALSSHVLKLGHHGSHRTSNTARWIEAVSPAFIFISADRHGSLDEQNKTGHRLPQTLTLALVEKHSKFLYKECVQHNVISAYDPSDYTAYNHAPDILNDTVTPVGLTKEWRQTPTCRGIFTSLVEMDATQADASEADQGAQYQLCITDDNVVDVTSTWKPGRLAKVQYT